MIYYGPFNEDRDRVPVQHLLAYGPMSIRRRRTVHRRGQKVSAWDETSILYGVRVGIMTILYDYAPSRFSAAFSEKSARDFSQLPQRLICKQEFGRKFF
eukprot:COSAG01_NODE_59719_length_298_cov_5.638191_1_plen_98_part_11